MCLELKHNLKHESCHTFKNAFSPKRVYGTGICLGC